MGKGGYSTGSPHPPRSRHSELMLLRWIRQRLTFLRNQNDKKLHPVGLTMVYRLVDVGRVLRVGLEIQLHPWLHLDRRLAGLLHAALARDNIDEFLTWMIMLAALTARLVLRNKDRDLFSRQALSSRDRKSTRLNTSHRC